MPGEDRGGLKYTVEAVDGFTKVFDQFSARLKALGAEADALLKKPGLSPTGGAKPAKPPKDPRVKDGQELSVIEKKLLALRKQLVVLNSKEVNQLQAVKNLRGQIAKLEQDRITTANAGLRAAKDEAVVAKKQASLSAKHRQDLLAINAQLKKGVKDEQAIAAAAGVTVKRVRELVASYGQAATQRERMLDAEKLAGQLTQARVANVASGKEAIRAEEAQAIATQRNLKSTNELAVKKAQILQIQKSQNVTHRRAAELVGVSSTQAKELGLNMWDAGHAARQFLFTFRRLVGILAIFTAARKFAQAFGSAVREMVSFNAEIETAEISIASIVASVGQIRDRTGQLVTGAEAFGTALEASRAILDQLKRDAIGSIATFEALVKAYQVAIGPGLAAGLDLNQIREVSNSLAEAAIRMGIPLNQLSEEIRSLLKGTATARNTRIAVLFGGAPEANEAIRNAKEQGNLYEFLTEKMEAMGHASEVSALSFDVLKANLQDTTQLLLKEGGIEYFIALKEAMSGFAQAVTQVNDAGEVEGFSPEALGVVQELSSALAGVITSFKQITDTRQALLLFRNILATLGDAIKALVPVASALFQGIITGANLALAPIRLVLDVIRQIAGKPLDDINKGLAVAIKYLTAGVVALFLWSKYAKLAAVWVGLTKLGIPLKIALTYIGLMLKGTQGLTIALASSAAGASTLRGILGSIWVSLGPIGVAILAISVIIAIIVTKTGILEKTFGSFNKEIKKGSKEAKGLEALISGSASAMEEGAKSAKEWADELRKLKASADIAEALKGVEGLSKDILSIIEEETAAYEERNRTALDIQKGLRVARSAAKEDLAQLKGVTAELEDQKDVTEEIFRLNMGDVPEIPFARIDTSSLLLEEGAAGITIPAEVSMDISAPTRELENLTNNVLTLTNKLKDNQEALNDDLSNTNKTTKERIRLLIAENGFLKEQIALDISKNQKEATEALYARANVSVKSLAIAKAEEKVLAQRYALENKAAQADLDSLKRRQEAYAKIASERELTVEENFALAVVEGQRARVIAKIPSDIARQEAELKKISDELRVQEGLLKNDMGVALKEGMQEFVRELPSLGEEIANTVTDALSDLAGVVADVFKDAIDPRTDVDLKTAFGEFFLDLAGQFMEAITQQLISSAIASMLPEAGVPVPDPTLVSNTVSLDLLKGSVDALNNTMASDALSSPVSPAVEVPSGGGGGSDVAAQAASKAGGFLAGLGSVAPWLLFLLLPIIMNMLASAFKKGGKVQGFASGGDVNKLPRPSNIPASDTVPAWLTPGEFVMRKEAVNKYGTGVMDAINRGIISPESFGRTVAPIMAQRQRGVRAFAQGGSVATGQAGASAGQAPRQIVLPILPVSEKNTNQILSGGRRALTDNVNKITVTGDPNANGGW